MQFVSTMFGLVRLPPRHGSAGRTSENDSRRWSYPITTEYGSFFFSVNILARRLKVVVASRPMPPAVEKTRCVKQPIPTSRTQSPYSLLFPLMLALEVGHGGVEVRGSERMKNPHVKKCLLHAYTPKPPNTNIQPGFLRSVCRAWETLVCDWLDFGSVCTSEHTSAIIFAVKSHNSWCRSEK